MSKEIKLSKAEIISQLKKEGVNNLDDFANMLVKKATNGGGDNTPIAQAVIVYGHGFLSH